jgi:hypothetical protein
VLEATDSACFDPAEHASIKRSIALTKEIVGGTLSGDFVVE